MEFLDPKPAPRGLLDPTAAPHGPGSLGSLAPTENHENTLEDNLEPTGFKL
jgi:hypothetical protein